MEDNQPSLKEGGELIKSADIHAGRLPEKIGPELDILVTDGHMGLDNELSELIDIFVSLTWIRPRPRD